MREEPESFFRERYAVFFLAFLAVLAIGICRYLTGPEWAFAVFYIFPIAYVAWNFGLRGGIFVSLLSFASWLTADLLMVEKFSSPWVPFLNQVSRLMVFLLVAVILHKHKISYGKIENMLLLDSLTGIHNRRAFFMAARREIDISQRYNRIFSLAYIDLDNFKSLNDKFGHAAGDLALAAIAEKIKNNIRASDLTARLGGDEFVVLFPETGDLSSKSAMERLNLKLSELTRENKWPITFSVGLVTYKKAPRDVDEMIRAADLLMYSAKEKGKGTIKHSVIGEDNESFQ